MVEKILSRSVRLMFASGVVMGAGMLAQPAFAQDAAPQLHGAVNIHGGTDLFERACNAAERLVRNKSIERTPVFPRPLREDLFKVDRIVQGGLFKPDARHERRGRAHGRPPADARRMGSNRRTRGRGKRFCPLFSSASSAPFKKPFRLRRPFLHNRIICL